MKIRWFGQSAFLLTGERSVAIDPFGSSMGELASSRGMVFDYPPIDGIEADLLLITHEHADHNGAETIGGPPVVIRSTAGTIDSPLGEVAAVASEHDELAGTLRGPNTIFRFELDGLVICHLGDLGQPALRPEQEQAIGQVDVLFVPVGGGPTVGGEAAAAIVRALGARLIVPMHYRTEAVNFLEPPDAFLAALGAPVERVAESEAEIEPPLAGDEKRVLVLAPPGR